MNKQKVREASLYLLVSILLFLLGLDYLIFLEYPNCLAGLPLVILNPINMIVWTKRLRIVLKEE